MSFSAPRATPLFANAKIKGFLLHLEGLPSCLKPLQTLAAFPPAPLVSLTEDEVLFRDTVRQFADESVRPYVKEMDEKGVFEHSLIDQFFQLGLMGIEVPEQYGGGGGHVLRSDPRGRGAFARRSLRWCRRRCAEHAGQQCSAALDHR